MPTDDRARLITSQIDTAPKLFLLFRFLFVSLITSQIDTAPKLEFDVLGARPGLITSQIDTAPKRTSGLQARAAV